ncbi:response regulator [Patescibacteria group bacterium]|nr:response regulator [Patescibacteria group bacterium]MBU2263537.1 response regulator [Patescibacteria group bacterium]
MARKYKVLIIDDDEFLVDMYSIKFREQGFDVEIAFSGNEAIEKIKSGLNPDMILVDLVMPNMDGFEFLREIKNKGIAKNSKLIILTNLGQEDDIKKGLALGADDYVIKAHFTPSEVIKKVTAVLEHD